MREREKDDERKEKGGGNKEGWRRTQNCSHLEPLPRPPFFKVFFSLFFKREKRKRRERIERRKRRNERKGRFYILTKNLQSRKERSRKYHQKDSSTPCSFKGGNLVQIMSLNPFHSCEERGKENRWEQKKRKGERDEWGGKNFKNVLLLLKHLESRFHSYRKKRRIFRMNNLLEWKKERKKMKLKREIKKKSLILDSLHEL